MNTPKTLLAITLALILTSNIAYAFWPFDYFSSWWYDPEKPTEFYITSPEHNANFEDESSIKFTWKKINFPEKTRVGFLVTRLDEAGNPIFATSFGGDIGRNSYKWRIPKGLDGTFNIEIYTKGIGDRIADSIIINLKGENKEPRIDSLTPNKGSLTPAYNYGYENTNALGKLVISGDNFITQSRNNIFIDFKYTEMGEELYDSEEPYLFGSKSEDGTSLAIDFTNSFSEVYIEPGAYPLYVVNLYGKSNPINLIIEEPTTPAITKILSPKEGDVWERGKTYQIEWKSRHLSTVNVALKSMVLGPSGMYSAPFIIRDTPDDGVEEWTIPLTQDPGSYSIQVTGDISQSFLEMDGSFTII